MSEQFYKNLGQRIKTLREEKGLSQEKAAQFLDINRASLSQIENGERKITAEDIKKLSDLFCIPTDTLLDLKATIKVDLQKEQITPEKQEIRINVPQKKVDRFKEVLLYVLNKVGSRPNIGETVLCKLLYFIDFDFYEKYEEQLIGATYTKYHFGPLPVEFLEIVKEMENNHELVKVQNQYFQYSQTKYLPLKEPDLSKFKAHEIKLIDEVLERLSHLSATVISDYSHGDVPWMTTEDGQVIDYEKAFYRQKPYSVRSYNDDGIQAEKESS